MRKEETGGKRWQVFRKSLSTAINWWQEVVCFLKKSFFSALYRYEYYFFFEDFLKKHATKYHQLRLCGSSFCFQSGHEGHHFSGKSFFTTVFYSLRA